MIFSDCIGYILQQYGLTGLGRSHNQATLAFAYGREHIYDTSRQIAGATTGQVKFFVGEKRREMFKWNTVTYKLGGATVYTLNRAKREIFLSLLRRTDPTVNDIAGL